MGYRKILLCFVFVFFSTTISAKTELPSNKSQFISLLNTKVGTYKLVSGSANVCTDGQLTWFDKSSPSLGFKLGEGIVFSALHHGTQTNKTANFCLVTTKYKYTTQRVTLSLRHTRCENQADNLDTSQMLHFISPTHIKYSVENTDVRCEFERQP